jgi:hypothetical protein
MPVVLVSGGLGIFAYLTGNINFSEYLLIPYIKDAGEINNIHRSYYWLRTRILVV